MILASHSAVWEGIGWTLIHMVWQGVVVAAALAAALSAMRESRASVRHTLCLAAMGALGVCPVVSLVRLAGSPVSVAPAGNKSASMPGMAFSSTAVPHQQPGSSTDYRLPERPPSAAIHSAAVRRTDWQLRLTRAQLRGFAVAWAAGVAFLLIWRVVGLGRVRRWLLQSREIHDSRLAAMKARLGVIRPVSIAICPRLPGPMLVAGRRPTILLPEALLEKLDERLLDAVLAHELAHLARRDDWTVRYESLIEILWFFHPGVWWIGSRLRQEREFATDDLAAASLNDRMAYALGLGRIAQLCTSTTAPTLGATSGGPLITRLRRLMNHAPPPSSPSAPAIIIALSLLTATSLALAADELRHRCQLDDSPDQTTLDTVTPVPNHAGPTTTTAQEPPAEGVAEPAKPDEPKAIAPRSFPSQAERAAATAVVQSFLQASTIEARLALVRFPEIIRPLMEKWHATRPLQPVQVSVDPLAESLSKFIHVNQTTFIVVTLLLPPDQKYGFFALECRSDGKMKLDWETAVGWQPMPLAEFLTSSPSRPQPFRLQAQPGDFYNGDFADATRWCSINLSHPDDPEISLHGYVERDSPVGKWLMALLGISETPATAVSRPLILSLATPPQGAARNQVVIHDVLHESWFLPDGPIQTP